MGDKERTDKYWKVIDQLALFLMVFSFIGGILFSVGEIRPLAIAAWTLFGISLFLRVRFNRYLVESRVI